MSPFLAAKNAKGHEEKKAETKKAEKEETCDSSAFSRLTLSTSRFFALFAA
jgi:hypothetical protein